MDIKDILDSLGLDLSNPEVRRGAMEAIDAILTSRVPATDGALNGGSFGGSGDTTEVELDPDLLQPSIKHAPSGINNDDIEIDDEENILDQIKHNEAEEPIENTNSAGKDSDSDDKSDSSQSSEDHDSAGMSGEKDEQPETDMQDGNSNDSKENELKNSTEDEVTDNVSSASDETDTETDEPDGDDDDSENTAEDSDTGEDEEDIDDIDTLNFDENEDETEIVPDYEDKDADEIDNTDPEDAEDEGEFDFDENDLIDDELKNSTEDEEIKTKHDARKIKRERTLAAAKKALTDAHAKKVSPALIRELEKAIEALEALTEAVTKSLKDISDAEFNQLVNRVFDAIQACGDSGLTFTSDEEREAQVKEIKDDMSSAQTQAELSAEDAAKIRAETQAIKAREKEAAKYTPRGRSSFKGFQEFLSSLYRAIALQVHHEETQDNSWSAINRRYGGTGILQPGKKIQELPNKKIPVIDFYFDQSGSWNANDIKVGEKAAQSLAEMEANGQIKINIYYFADNVHTDAASARAEGGTGAWNEIVKNVIATQATNVIIMTDDDMEGYWGSRGNALSYTVPGYVWYLWKNGENAPRLPRDLKGRGGVQQFAFSANDVQ